MLLNLASVIDADTPEMVAAFVRRYRPDADPAATPFLDALTHHAVAYTRDFVRPSKRFRAPTPVERAALEDLAAELRALSDASPEDIQTRVYEVGKRHPLPDLRAWFGCLYQVLLGQAEGPRFGGFVALYGVPETIALIDTALAREVHDDAA